MGQQTMLGALAGHGPDVAVGRPPMAGLALWDEFHDLSTANWTATTIGASAPTHSMQTPTGWDEIGVARAATAAATGTGGVLLRSGVADLYRIPPPGSVWAARIRMVTGATAYDLWSGFASAAASVRTADATQFCGVRQDRAVSGNLWGVVKDGAGSETVVDLGISCEGSVWQWVGLEVGGTTAAPSVQFVVYDMSWRGRWNRVPVGSEITTTMPTVPLFSCALGIVARAVSSKAAEIDAWALGGRVER